MSARSLVALCAPPTLTASTRRAVSAAAARRASSPQTGATPASVRSKCVGKKKPGDDCIIRSCRLSSVLDLGLEIFMPKPNEHFGFVVRGRTWKNFCIDVR